MGDHLLPFSSQAIYSFISDVFPHRHELMMDEL